MTNMKTYDTYKENVLKELSQEVRKGGLDISPGCWQGITKDEYTHILPLSGPNNRESRISAIKKYLGVSIDDTFFPRKKGVTLHQYAHHLNSSQLLCYMTFRPMLNDNQTPHGSLIQLLSKLGINISSNAICNFEYKDGMQWLQGNEDEGTSFDFHICDSSKKTEYFFEIKFTENGFGKAGNDSRHLSKINDLYLPQINKVFRPYTTVEDCQNYYQIFRNVIRASSDSKTTVFITDASNPNTQKELDSFQKKFDVNSSDNIKFMKWQDIKKNWPTDISQPFQFVCF